MVFFDLKLLQWSLHLLLSSRVAEATSNTRRMCAIPRSLARGHDKSCDPRHGTKISLILKGVSDPRIRD